jgi:protease-4
MDLNDKLQHELALWLRGQRRRRIMRVVLLAIVVVGVVGAIGAGKVPAGNGFNMPGDEKFVPLVRIEGMIAGGRQASLERLQPALKQAFASEDADGVILSISSPGGSPAQSQMLYEELLRLKKKHNKRIVVATEDTLASGAYLLAMAADTIYAMPSSTVGSIGAIMQSTGYYEAADKWGFERRTYTAGGNKSRFDPMQPERPADREKAKELLSEVHAQFIEVVEKGRGDKLKGDRELLFSGDFWTGSKAQELGLVDELGSLFVIVENEFQADGLREFQPAPNVGGLLSMLTTKLGLYSPHTPQVMLLQH